MNKEELFKKLKSRNKETIKLSLREFLNEQDNSLVFNEYITEMKKLRLYNKLKTEEMNEIWKYAINPKLYYYDRENYYSIVNHEYKIKALETKRIELIKLMENNQIRFNEDIKETKIQRETTSYPNSFNKIQDNKILTFLNKSNINSICLSQRQLGKLKRLLKQEKRKPISIIAIRRLNGNNRIIDKGYFRLKTTKQMYETKKALLLCRKPIDSNFYCKQRINCNKSIYTRIKPYTDKRIKDLTRNKKIRDIKQKNQFNCNYCYELREMKKTYIKRINKSYQVFYYIKNFKDITISSYIREIGFNDKLEDKKGKNHYTIYLRRNRLFNLKSLNYDTYKLNLNERLHNSYLKNALINDDLKLLYDTIKLRRLDLRLLKPYRIENIPFISVNYSTDKNKYVKMHDGNIQLIYYKYFDTRKEFRQFNSNIYQLCNLRLEKEKLRRKHIKNIEYKSKVNLLDQYNKVNKGIILNVELGINRVRKRKFDKFDDENHDIIVYNRRLQDKNQLNSHIKTLERIKSTFEDNYSSLKNESTKERYNRVINYYDKLITKFTKLSIETIRIIQVNYQRKFSMWNNKQRNKFFLFFFEFLESKLRTNLNSKLRFQLYELYRLEHSENYNQLLVSLEDKKELYQYFLMIYNKCFFNKVKKILIKPYTNQ